MIILKKDFNLKTILIVAIVFASALFVDANFSTSNSSENIQEARFLGIGNNTTYGPCVDGASVATTTFSIFWINVSSSQTLTGC